MNGNLFRVRNSGFCDYDVYAQRFKQPVKYLHVNHRHSRSYYTTDIILEIHSLSKI